MGSPASQRLSTPREAPSGSTNCTPAPIPQVAVMACLACERFATVVDGEEKEGVLGQWLLDCDVAATEAQVLYAADLDAGAAGDDGGGGEGISGLFPTIFRHEDIRGNVPSNARPVLLPPLATRSPSEAQSAHWLQPFALGMAGTQRQTRSNLCCDNVSAHRQLRDRLWSMHTEDFLSKLDCVDLQTHRCRRGVFQTGPFFAFTSQHGTVLFACRRMWFEVSTLGEECECPASRNREHPIRKTGSRTGQVGHPLN